MAFRAFINLDFEVDNGILFIHFWNAGTCAALDCRFTFNKPLMGMGQQRDLSKIGIFQKLSYLAPNRHFRVLIDPVGTFLAPFEDKDPIYRISLTYRDEIRRRPEKCHFEHNLGIYKDLPEIIKND